MASSPNVIRYPIHDIHKHLGGDESSSESSSSGSARGMNEGVGQQSRSQRKQRTRPHTPPSLSTRSLPAVAGKHSSEPTSPFHDATFIIDTDEDNLPPSITYSPPLSPSDLSPPGSLRSRWSSDSSFHDSGDEPDPHSRSPLEHHLDFVASVSPVSSMDSRARSDDTGLRQGTLDLPRSSSPGSDELSYDTDSTLSLMSCNSESDADTLSDSEDGSTDRDGRDFQSHNARESELQEYFTPSSPRSTKEGNTSKRMHYTHGHTLQRMPGMVKGFSQVPHYHHHEHSEDSAQDVGDGRKRASTLSLASAVPRRLLEDSDVTSAESSDEEFECLGSGFINLNLSETGRDVRVLVRSKQTKARAAGGSLLDYDRILNELLVEEPALFQDTDDQYHRRLIMYPRDAPQFMIKRLPLSSSELRIILELSQPDVRDVAWNPTPRVICAIDRPRLCLLTDKYIGNESLGRPDDDVFLFFEPLEDIEPNPARMGSADYLDMFKELLEGLTFLHQHHAMGFRANVARSFMRLPSPIRRGRLPRSGICTPIRHANRDAGQLRYHFVDFAEAHRCNSPSPSCPSTAHPSTLREDWKKDVQELGSLLEATLREKLPSEVQDDFMPLATLMVDGRISADAARVMFMDVLRNGEIERELRKEAKARDVSAQQTPFVKKPSVLGKVTVMPDSDETSQRGTECSITCGEAEGEIMGVAGGRGRSGTITSR